MNEVILSREIPHVAVLTLNRPEHRNALDLATRQSLATHFEQLATDQDCRVVVITGGEEVFAAGADIRMLAEKDSSGIVELGLAQFWKPIVSFPKPVIAAVNGLALGGGFELVMHSDVIFAGESAQFGLPEPRVGIMPGAGGTQRLVRAIGKFSAMHLLLSARPIKADRAYALGIVSEVSKDSETINNALVFATKVANLPPIAIASIKCVVLEGADLPLAEAIEMEQEAFFALFDTADKTEGMMAFLEKRKPKFTGQ